MKQIFVNRMQLIASFKIRKYKISKVNVYVKPIYLVILMRHISVIIYVYPNAVKTVTTNKISIMLAPMEVVVIVRIKSNIVATNREISVVPK